MSATNASIQSRCSSFVPKLSVCRQGGDRFATDEFRQRYVASFVNLCLHVVIVRANIDEAFTEQRRAADLWAGTLGPDHPHVAAGNHNLALLSLGRVVVGGGIVERMGDAIIAPIAEAAWKDVFPDECRNTAFVMTALGDNAGLLGASLIARDAVG